MPEKRQSAFIKATQAAQQAPTPAPVNTVTPLEGDTVTKQARPTVQREASAEPKVDKKVTFYLTQNQVDKLDQLEIDFRQSFKRKVNRNEIVRFLIDQCNIDKLAEL